MITSVKWRQIAGGLRAQIARGDLRPGDPLPSEQELADYHNVARGTARVALQHLVQTGVAVDGSPRRVAHPELLTVHIARTADLTSPGESPTLGADAWLADMRAAGRVPEHDLEVIARQADHELARRLEVGEDSAVVARRQLRYAGDRPHNEITYWYPAGVAHGTPLASPASMIEGALAWLEANYGTLAHEVEITARMPGEDETARLQIPGGVPVAVVWRTSRNLAGLPLVTSMAVYPADRTRLALVL